MKEYRIKPKNGRWQVWLLVRKGEVLVEVFDTSAEAVGYCASHP